MYTILFKITISVSSMTAALIWFDWSDQNFLNLANALPIKLLCFYNFLQESFKSRFRSKSPGVSFLVCSIHYSVRTACTHFLLYFVSNMEQDCARIPLHLGIFKFSLLICRKPSLRLMSSTHCLKKVF